MSPKSPVTSISGTGLSAGPADGGATERPQIYRPATITTSNPVIPAPIHSSRLVGLDPRIGGDLPGGAGVMASANDRMPLVRVQTDGSARERMSVIQTAPGLR